MQKHPWLHMKWILSTMWTVTASGQGRAGPWRRGEERGPGSFGSGTLGGSPEEARLWGPGLPGCGGSSLALTLSPPWLRCWRGAPPAGRGSRGLHARAPVRSPVWSPVDTAPSGQSPVRLSALVLRPTRHLHSAHTHRCTGCAQTSSRTENSWRPGGFGCTLAQITGTSGIRFSPCQLCPGVRPRQHRLLPRAQQPVPVQRGKPPPPREVRGCGAAQRGLPELARPGLACSRPPCVTLGDLLVNDPRHRGWGLNHCPQHLRNLCSMLAPQKIT